MHAAGWAARDENVCMRPARNSGRAARVRHAARCNAIYQPSGSTAAAAFQNEPIRRRPVNLSPTASNCSPPTYTTANSATFAGLPSFAKGDQTGTRFNVGDIMERLISLRVNGRSFVPQTLMHPRNGLCTHEKPSLFTLNRRFPVTSRGT